MTDEEKGWTIDVAPGRAKTKLTPLGEALALALQNTDAELQGIRLLRRRYVWRLMMGMNVLGIFAALVVAVMVVPTFSNRAADAVGFGFIAWTIVFAVIGGLVDTGWFAKLLRLHIPPPYVTIDAAIELRRNAHWYCPKFAQLAEATGLTPRSAGR